MSNNETEVKFRPISAANQRPAFMLKKEKQQNKQATDFPQLKSSTTTCVSLYETNSKNRNIVGIAKERLYEELLQYKNNLNSLTKEIALLKSDNNKKSQELLKKDKLVEEMMGEPDNLFSIKDSKKVKEAYLISSLRTQYKEVKNQLDAKSKEYDELKKHIKNTKFNELTLEIDTLNEEISNLAKICNASSQQNYNFDKLTNEINVLKDLYYNEQIKSENQSQIIFKLENDLRELTNSNLKLKEALDKKNQLYKKLEVQLNNQKKINSSLASNKDDNNLIKNLKANYEKQIETLNKEINFFIAKAE